MCHNTRIVSYGIFHVVYRQIYILYHIISLVSHGITCIASYGISPLVSYCTMWKPEIHSSNS